MKKIVNAVIAVVVLAGVAGAQEFGSADMIKSVAVPSAAASVVPLNQLSSAGLADTLNGIKLGTCLIWSTSKSDHVYVSVIKDNYNAISTWLKPGFGTFAPDGVYRWLRAEKTANISITKELEITVDSTGRITALEITADVLGANIVSRITCK